MFHTYGLSPLPLCGHKDLVESYQTSHKLTKDGHRAAATEVVLTSRRTSLPDLISQHLSASPNTVSSLYSRQ